MTDPMDDFAPSDPPGAADGGDADSGVAKGERTRRRIKNAALRLFAQSGLEDVSVRDILKAAGQKNAGSINYYFQSRADLIAELMRDVARMIDDNNAQLLDALEASGRPFGMRDVIKILLTKPQTPSQDGDEGEAQDDSDYSLRFFNMVLSNHRHQLFEAMRGQDRGTRRCLAHLRRMAPPLPEPLLRQRLMLIVNFAVSAASAREAATNDESAQANLWGHPTVSDNLADMMLGILTHPPSSETLSKLADAPDPG